MIYFPGYRKKRFNTIEAKEKMIHFNYYAFSDLNLMQLYQILSLRASIFVVDQQCPYLDPDGKDYEAIHLLGTDTKANLLAYLRVFPPTANRSHIIFGRVVTAKSVRQLGYGKKLMEKFISYCAMHYPKVDIKCSAQSYLQKFYESFGFKAYGQPYLEDNILHVAMEKICE